MSRRALGSPMTRPTLVPVERRPNGFTLSHRPPRCAAMMQREDQECITGVSKNMLKAVPSWGTKPPSYLQRRAPLPSWHNKWDETGINTAGLSRLGADVPESGPAPRFSPLCSHVDFQKHHQSKSLNCKPDVAMRSRSEAVFHSRKNTGPLRPSEPHRLCSLLGSTVSTLWMSVWTAKLTLVTHAHKHTQGALRVKRRKMRSRERRSLKFHGDTGEERRAAAAEAQASPATGLISMKMSLPLPWLLHGCHDTLVAWEDVQLQGSA